MRTEAIAVPLGDCRRQREAIALTFSVSTIVLCPVYLVTYKLSFIESTPDLITV